MRCPPIPIVDPKRTLAQSVVPAVSISHSAGLGSHSAKRRSALAIWSGVISAAGCSTVGRYSQHFHPPLALTLLAPLLFGLVIFSIFETGLTNEFLLEL